MNLRRRLKAATDWWLAKAGWELRRRSQTSDPNRHVATVLNYLSTDLVIDVGANTGQFAAGIRRAGYSGRIVSFEPVSAAYDQLLRAAAKDSLWDVAGRMALGDRVGELSINISGNSVSSSALPMRASHVNADQTSAYTATETVPQSTLDIAAATYLKEAARPFLKIDTQGFEWAVLDGATNTLPSTVGILCELSLIELYEGQRLWGEILTRLKTGGFKLWAIQRGFTDEQTGQSLQIDGLFVRS